MEIAYAKPLKHVHDTDLQYSDSHTLVDKSKITDVGFVEVTEIVIESQNKLKFSYSILV